MITLKIKLRKQDVQHLGFDLKEELLNDVKGQIRIVRNKYLYKVNKKKWYNDSAVEYYQQILFAKLDKALGKETKAVKYLQELKEEYLKEVAAIWKNYYHEISHSFYSDYRPYEFWREQLHNKRREEQAVRLIQLYNLKKFKPGKINGHNKLLKEIRKICSYTIDELIEFTDSYVNNRVSWDEQAAVTHIVCKNAHLF